MTISDWAPAPEPLLTLGPRSVLGECPIWDGRLQALFWVDIQGRRVHRWDCVADEHSAHLLTVRPGSIALTTAPGTLLVAAERALGLLDWTTGAIVWKLQLDIAEPTVRLNDGRVDRSGNFWVGTMHVPASDERYVGSLFRVRPDWSAEEVLTDIGVANGLAFGDDGSSMYFADTLTLTVWRFDIDSAGTLGRRVPFVDFGVLGLPGKPDGACLDADGCYWTACVHGSSIARITPHGAIDRLIRLPTRRPTCVAFGGPTLDTLFVTSIGGGHEYYPVFDDEPDGGRLVALDVDVTGVEEAVFGSEPEKSA